MDHLCYCTVFASFYFEFEGNFRVQAPGGLYLEGRFIGEFFALRVWGAYIWKSLYMKGLSYRILRWLFSLEHARGNTRRGALTFLFSTSGRGRPLNFSIRPTSEKKKKKERKKPRGPVI